MTHQTSKYLSRPYTHLSHELTDVYNGGCSTNNTAAKIGLLLVSPLVLATVTVIQVAELTTRVALAALLFIPYLATRSKTDQNTQTIKLNFTNFYERHFGLRNIQRNLNEPIRLSHYIMQNIITGFRQNKFYTDPSIGSASKSQHPHNPTSGYPKPTAPPNSETDPANNSSFAHHYPAGASSGPWTYTASTGPSFRLPSSADCEPFGCDAGQAHLPESVSSAHEGEAPLYVRGLRRLPVIIENSEAGGFGASAVGASIARDAAALHAAAESYSPPPPKSTWSSWISSMIRQPETKVVPIGGPPPSAPL